MRKRRVGGCADGGTALPAAQVLHPLLLLGVQVVKGLQLLELELQGRMLLLLGCWATIYRQLLCNVAELPEPVSPLHRQRLGSSHGVGRRALVCLLLLLQQMLL